MELYLNSPKRLQGMALTGHTQLHLLPKSVDQFYL
jgi:hypothetical protein